MKRDGFAVYTSSPRATMTFDLIIIILEKAALHMAGFKVKKALGCFPLCQTDRSEISGTIQGKWNDIFRLNRANQ